MSKYKRVAGVQRVRIQAGPLGSAFVDAVHDAAQKQGETVTNYLLGSVRWRMRGENRDCPDEAEHREVSGRPPLQGREQIDVRFHNLDLVDAIKEAADAQGETLSDYIRRAVQVRLAREGTPFPATFVAGKVGRR